MIKVRGEDRDIAEFDAPLPETGKHTPLPWKVVPAPKGYVLIVDETDRRNIAQISTNSRTKAENEANASLIVRAVNAHEGLVKALAASKTWLDLFVDKLNLDPSETVIDVKAASPAGERIIASKSLGETLAEIETALKQSEGQP